jgi:hypothetical protein
MYCEYRIAVLESCAVALDGHWKRYGGSETTINIHFLER